jgi:hypothetical protein
VVEKVKELSEFKEGLSALNSSNNQKAEDHFKECLKILKNSDQTETIAYIYTLKKYTQSLFLNKKFTDCENHLKASIQIANQIFGSQPEYIFSYYRNLLAFYTYTDINKASDYVTGLLNQQSVQNSNVFKYFLFAGGSVKFMNNEYGHANELMNKAIENKLPSKFDGHNLHNIALLKYESKRVYDLLVRYYNKGFS